MFGGRAGCPGDDLLRPSAAHPRPLSASRKARAAAPGIAGCAPSTDLSLSIAAMRARPTPWAPARLRVLPPKE
ncbi:hypothetical protein DVR11_03280 [Paracoccus versutus]|nr:hypothetical protein IT40_03085 [Paracoccus versutus]RDD72964.1 hypothetical protein DVR11_03280 [Paracoccus versutus]